MRSAAVARPAETGEHWRRPLDQDEEQRLRTQPILLLPDVARILRRSLDWMRRAQHRERLYCEGFPLPLAALSDKGPTWNGPAVWRWVDGTNDPVADDQARREARRARAQAIAAEGRE